MREIVIEKIYKIFLGMQQIEDVKLFIKYF